MIKQVRLSNQAKEQLIKLKARTGIQHWNVLCRWALCISLRETTPPTPIEIPADSNVEMSWHVFGGEWHEQFLAALKERCFKDGLDISPDTLNRQFRLHLHRGISYLTTPGKIRNIRDFIQIALIDEDFKINGQKLGDFF
jgi:DNA sulfur modification protein DndE